MVNPGGLISRMTVAQLVEMVAGRVGVEVAAKLNATTFCNGGDYVKQLGDVLELLGSSRAGDNVLYSGITGAQIRTDIFMCPLYFMRLKHLTEDKVNARGFGKREMRTHQPTGGRANEGGLRVGEMERDSLCAHGVSAFLQESMMKRGDATSFWVCNGCGRIPIYNEPEGLFVCPTCDGPLTYTGVTPETLTMQLPTKQSRATFSKIAMPYSMKLLDQEMTTFGNMGMRFVAEGSVSRLREYAWDWPTTDVGFEIADRGVEAAAAVNPAEKAAAEAAAETKPKRKNKAAVAGLSAEDAAATVEDATAVRFGAKLENEFKGLSNYEFAAFRITGPQIPASDGTVYPELGIAADGSLDVAKQTWPTVEHYYQAMKFPTDPAWQEAIRQASTAGRPAPAKAKTMGSDAKHARRGDWEQVKDRVMKAALVAKFQQNPPLLALLQSTGNRKLIEASSDPYWGGGKLSSFGGGKGQNKLGKLMKEVRTELGGERPDLGLVPAAQGQEGQEGPEESEDVVTEAQDAVAAAAGVIKLATIPEVTEGSESKPPVQQGGVYLFINSGAQVEPKARRDRGRGRNLTWEGMAGSQAGGGGGGSGVEEMTTQSGGALEVSVEKLG
jgi:ribA/ribD-fused uncharacterized protein